MVSLKKMTIELPDLNIPWHNNANWESCTTNQKRQLEIHEGISFMCLGKWS